MPDARRNAGTAARRARASAPRGRARSQSSRTSASAEPSTESTTGHIEEDSQRQVDIGPLKGYLGYALRRAQMLAYADFIAALAELNLSPGQFGVLTVIDTNPGLRQSEVSRALGIQKTNFVALLNSFERRGLAVRKPAADKRSYALYLTPAGQVLLRRARTAQARHESRLINRIGEQGREQLLQLLRRLTAGE